MNSQEALELLATDKELTGENYRVLLLLLSRLDFENWIQIAQSEIAEKLDMRKQNVSRAISLLELKGILQQHNRAKILTVDEIQIPFSIDMSWTVLEKTALIYQIRFLLFILRFRHTQVLTETLLRGRYSIKTKSLKPLLNKSFSDLVRG